MDFLQFLAMDFLQFLAIFLVIFLFIRTIINLFKPNHLPPSPIGLPIIGHFHLLSLPAQRSLHKLSLRYGSIFSIRLGSVPCIVISAPELAKEFLRTNELSFSSHINSIAIAVTSNDCSMSFSPYGPYWKFIKKLVMNELLGSRCVTNFLSFRAEEYRKFLRFLAAKSESAEAVNLSLELRKLTNRLASKMMLGVDKEEQLEEIRTTIRDGGQIIADFNLADFVWFFKVFDFQGFDKKIKVINARNESLFEKIICEREELRKKSNKEEDVKLNKSLLDILLDVSEDDNAEIKITRVHIKALLLEFMSGSTDTTAMTVEWAIAEMINHPKVFEKAREEINRVVGKERLVGESDCSNLPYIQAIVKETLRLHPSFPMVMRKCVQQCQIGEKYIIPENTTLFVNIWAIGRDPNYWDNPLEFRPERFLPQQVRIDGEKIMNNMGFVDVRGQHFQVLPFGSGRRMCAGMNLAMQILPGLVAGLIQCFDWKVVGEKMNSDDNIVLDMDEALGASAPRAHDLICVPVARFAPFMVL